MVEDELTVLVKRGQQRFIRRMLFIRAAILVIEVIFVIFTMRFARQAIGNPALFYSSQVALLLWGAVFSALFLNVKGLYAWYKR